MPVKMNPNLACSEIYFIFQVVDTLIRAIKTDKVMKVRWNACYAAGGILRYSQFLVSNLFVFCPLKRVQRSNLHQNPDLNDFRMVQISNGKYKMATKVVIFQTIWTSMIHLKQSRLVLRQFAWLAGPFKIQKYKISRFQIFTDF